MKPTHTPARFSFLFPDLLIFNIIHFVLIAHMDTMMNTQAHYYMLFVIFNNMAWLICSHIAGIYNHERIYKVKELLNYTFITYLFFALITWLFFDLNFLTDTINFVLFDIIWFGLFLLISRIAMIGIVKFIERTGIFRKRVVIIGNSIHASPLIEQLEKKHIFYEIKGFFDDNENNFNSEYPWLGKINDCLTYAKDNNISEIYTVIPPDKMHELYPLANDAQNNFIKFKFAPHFNTHSKYKYSFEFDNNIPIISLNPEPLEEISGQLQKRLFDIIFSSLVIAFILSWLIPIIAVLIKMESDGPVFFKQYRTGKNNRPFLCLKFRSLKVNADADIKQVTENDDRYTRVGKFLRRTNLDEFPQFFNVLAGDMSVVGSRPHMLKHTEDYSRLHGSYMQRHSIKPGLTGWAQINGYRGEIKVDEQLIQRVEHDLWYIENWNFLLDMRIVLQTLSSTFKGDKNAY